MLAHYRVTPQCEGVGVGGGVLAVYMTQGSSILFWIENMHALHFSCVSKDLP